MPEEQVQQAEEQKPNIDPRVATRKAIVAELLEAQEAQEQGAAPEPEKAQETPPKAEEPALKEEGKAEAEPEGEEQEASGKAEEGKGKPYSKLKMSWSNLIKLQKGINEAKVSLKAEREALNKELAPLREMARELEEDQVGFFYKRLGTEGLKALNARILNSGKPAPDEEARIWQRKAEQAEQQTKKLQADTQQAAVAKNLDAYRGALRQAADKDPERFELTILRDRIEDALNVAVRHWMETGGREIMKPEDALEAIEQDLVETEVKPFFSTKKVQKLYPSSNQAPKGTSSNGSRTKAPKNIPNKVAGSGPQVHTPASQMTPQDARRESRREAIREVLEELGR